MDFGRIKRDDSPISLKEVEAFIESSEWLGRMPEGRTMKNPFTGEIIPVPTEGRAYCLIEGKLTGAISLEDGEVLTDGIPIEICWQIAMAFDAQYVEDDRS